MLQKLKELLAPISGENRSSSTVESTVATLLAEAALSDGDVDSDERTVAEKALSVTFDLDPAAAAVLFEQGLARAQASVDLYSPARDIRKALPAEKRVQLIEMLWAEVYADGRLDDREADLMRRIAKLLYVDDRDSANARRRVKNRVGV